MYKWSQLWQKNLMLLNVIIISFFTRSNNPILFTYNMNGVPLTSVDEIRDLGVVITSSLFEMLFVYAKQTVKNPVNAELLGTLAFPPLNSRGGGGGQYIMECQICLKTPTESSA